MNRRKFLGGAAAVATAGAFVAQTPSVWAQSRGKITVLIGTAPPDPACHFFYHALEKGFYRERGIDVDLQPIGAETMALRALLASEGDVAWCGGISTLQAVAAGSKLRVLSCFTPRLDYLVVGKKDITSLKGFEGRSMAVSQVGAVSQIVPRLMIEGKGGDQSKVQWVSVGASAARLQSVIAKRVDGAPMNSVFAVRALKYDYLHVIGDALADLPHFMYTWDVTSADTLEKKRDTLTAFVGATAKGARWAMDNPDEAGAISQKVLPDLPPEETLFAARDFAKKKFFSPTGKLARETWDFTVETLVRLGNIKQPMKYEDIVLADLVDKANA
jgi:ABC-type nitrate/sulfonate/bicarbonate transport system substrate-binding protein